VIRSLRRRLAHEERGFSLVESMIVVFLLGIVTASILTTIVRSSATSQFSLDRNEALDQLRVMAANFTKDVRQGIEATAISRSSVTFNTYVNGTVQSVTWSVLTVAGSEELQRKVGTGTATPYVIDLTTNQVFSFGDGVDPATVDPSSIDRIGLDLATQPDPRHPPVDLSTVVEMRNVP
jgi:prepilin-type N-terminal cleavage/methylation domain-containing protein